MRLITFILSSGIALTWIPASASAQKITYGEGTIKVCTQAEGYIDCPHVYPMQPTANSSGPAPRQRAYGSLGSLGSLWQPRRARQPR
jgi:hypothetical protein